jgi:hypothetical protein
VVLNVDTLKNNNKNSRTAVVPLTYSILYSRSGFSNTVITTSSSRIRVRMKTILGTTWSPLKETRGKWTRTSETRRRKILERGSRAER